MERTYYRPLNAGKAPEGAGIHQPGTFANVTIDSPALSVMTDLRLVSAATVGPERTLAEATRMMIARGVRLLFVLDAGGALAGLITARDTQGERPIQLAHDRGAKFAELRVADLMIARADIDLIAFDDVLHAEVGHVVATLKAWGRQHALVGERDAGTGQMRVRGLFSATQIGRQLGIALQPFEVARTFAEIERTLFDE